MKHAAVRLSVITASLLTPLLTLGACAYDEPAPAARSVSYSAPEADPKLRDAQAQLRTLGLYGGPVDGVWGPETAGAVERFQRDHSFVVTARLDDATMAALHAATVADPLTVTGVSNVRTIQNRLTQLGYYDGPADGVWSRDTQLALEKFQRARDLPPGEVTVVTVSALGLDPDAFETSSVTTRTATAPEPASLTPLEPGVIRGVQQRLRIMGFYRGAADGIWGPATQSALIAFQRSRGLEASGDLTPTTASVMGLNPNDLRRSVTTSYRP